MLLGSFFSDIVTIASSELLHGKKARSVCLMAKYTKSNYLFFIIYCKVTINTIRLTVNKTCERMANLRPKRRLEGAGFKTSR